jgi:hypothetical protein
VEGEIGDCDFMKHYNLAYLPNEFPKKFLGCIAKQATRSMNDLGCCMNCVGQTKHKQIVTKRAANSGGRSRSRSVVDTFHPSFVCTSETKSNSAMNTTVGGVGLKKKVSKHFVCHCLVNRLHLTNKKVKLCISST